MQYVLPLVGKRPAWVAWSLEAHELGSDVSMAARFDAETMSQMCASVGSTWPDEHKLWWRVRDAPSEQVISSTKGEMLKLDATLLPRGGTSGRLLAMLRALMGEDAGWRSLWATGMVTASADGFQISPTRQLSTRLRAFLTSTASDEGHHLFLAHERDEAQMQALAARSLVPAHVHALRTGRPPELPAQARHLILSIPEDPGALRALPSWLDAIGHARTLPAKAISQTRKVEVRVTQYEEERLSQESSLARLSEVEVTPLVGRLVQGRYRITGELGRGGFGSVYLAEDERLERDVALKVMNPELFGLEQHDSLMKRFSREAKLVARLDHPHIAPVLDYGDVDLEEQRCPFYVMKFLQGEDLHDVLAEQGPLELERALELTRQMLDALAYVHQHDVIHRDLKPENVFITESRQAGLQEHLHLVDFGIAYVEDKVQGRLTATAHASPRTPDYAPPELLLGGEQTAAIDVYQVGLILCEMLTGQVLLRHARSRLDDLVPDQLDQGPLGEMLRRSLAARVEDRFPNASAMLEALEALEVSALELPAFASTQALEAQAPHTGPGIASHTEREQVAIEEAVRSPRVRPSPSSRPRPVRTPGRQRPPSGPSTRLPRATGVASTLLRQRRLLRGSPGPSSRGRWGAPRRPRTPRVLQMWEAPLRLKRSPPRRPRMDSAPPSSSSSASCCLGWRS